MSITSTTENADFVQRTTNSPDFLPDSDSSEESTPCLTPSGSITELPFTFTSGMPSLKSQPDSIFRNQILSAGSPRSVHTSFDVSLDPPSNTSRRSPEPFQSSAMQQCPDAKLPMDGVSPPQPSINSQGFDAPFPQSIQCFQASENEILPFLSDAQLTLLCIEYLVQDMSACCMQGRDIATQCELLVKNLNNLVTAQGGVPSIDDLRAAINLERQVAYILEVCLRLNMRFDVTVI